MSGIEMLAALAVAVFTGLLVWTILGRVASRAESSQPEESPSPPELEEVRRIREQAAVIHRQLDADEALQRRAADELADAYEDLRGEP